MGKNILLSQFGTYNSFLKSGGLLLLSGFYVTDVDDLISAKELGGYNLIEKLEKETWCGLKFQKHGQN